MTPNTDTAELVKALRAIAPDTNIPGFMLSAAARLEALQGAVDKLPKTADGVYPGMGQALYYVNRGPRGGVKILDYRVGWDEIDGKVMAGLYWHCRHDCDEYISFTGETEVGECYSTEAAALAASSPAGADGAGEGE